MELLPHAGYGEEDRGTAGTQVLRNRGQALGEPGLAARHDLADVADDPFGDVAEREIAEQPVIGRQPDHRLDGTDRPLQVAVRQHGALRRSGRTARVDERGDVVGADPGDSIGHDGRRGSEFVAAIGSQSVEVDHDRVAIETGGRRQCDHQLEFGEVLEVQQHLGELLGALDEAHFRPGVVQHVGDLRRRAGRVDGHGDGTDREDRHIGDVPFRSIAGQQADTVAGADPECHEASGGLLDDRAVVTPQQWLPVAIGMLAQRRAFGL